MPFQEVFDACKSGDVATLSFLLDAKMDVRSTDNDGNSLLMIASQSNRLKAVKLLLDNGACKSKNLNKVDAYKFAKQRNYPQVVKLFENHRNSLYGDPDDPNDTPKKFTFTASEPVKKNYVTKVDQVTYQKLLNVVSNATSFSIEKYLSLMKSFPDNNEIWSAITNTQKYEFIVNLLIDYKVPLNGVVPKFHEVDTYEKLSGILERDSDNDDKPKQPKPAPAPVPVSVSVAESSEYQKLLNVVSNTTVPMIPKCLQAVKSYPDNTGCTVWSLVKNSTRYTDIVQLLIEYQVPLNGTVPEFTKVDTFSKLAALLKKPVDKDDSETKNVFQVRKLTAYILAFDFPSFNKALQDIPPRTDGTVVYNFLFDTSDFYQYVSALACQEIYLFGALPVLSEIDTFQKLQIKLNNDFYVSTTFAKTVESIKLSKMKDMKLHLSALKMDQILDHDLMYASINPNKPSETIIKLLIVKGITINGEIPEFPRSKSSVSNIMKQLKPYRDRNPDLLLPDNSDNGVVLTYSQYLKNQSKKNVNKVDHSLSHSSNRSNPSNLQSSSHVSSHPSNNAISVPEIKKVNSDDDRSLTLAQSIQYASYGNITELHRILSHPMFTKSEYQLQVLEAITVNTPHFEQIIQLLSGYQFSIYGKPLSNSLIPSFQHLHHELVQGYTLNLFTDFIIPSLVIPYRY